MCCKECSILLPTLEIILLHPIGPFHNEIQLVLMPLVVNTKLIDQHILDQYHNEIDLKET